MGGCQSSQAVLDSSGVNKSTTKKTPGSRSGGSSDGKKKKNSYQYHFDSSGRHTEVSISAEVVDVSDRQQQQQQLNHSDLHHHEEATDATVSDGYDTKENNRQQQQQQSIQIAMNDQTAKTTTMSSETSSLPPRGGGGETDSSTNKKSNGISIRYSRVMLASPSSSASTSKNKVCRKNFKPGYSSGGSSISDTEHSGSDDASRRHLVDIKNELGADGDLCKGVVHIEVRKSAFECDS